MQIKLYISVNNIDFKNRNQLSKILKICFNKINLINIIKHILYQFYQINKSLKMFLNIFL